MAATQSRHAWLRSGSTNLRVPARLALPLTWALLCAAGLHAASQTLLSAEQGLLARIQTLLPAPPLPQELRIVAIDELSLDQAANGDMLADPLLRRLGPWPWPREAHARVVNRLRQLGARAVVFDIRFDTASLRGAADDRSLAEAIRAFPGPVVLGAELLEAGSQRGGSDTIAGISLRTPLPLFVQAGARSGLMNALDEDDGAIRQPPSRYPQLLRQHLPLPFPDSLAQVLFEQMGGRRPRDPGEHWQTLLRFYGPPGTVPTVSIWQLLANDRFEQLRASGDLKNTVVLVGPTAISLQDQHRAAFAEADEMPGVEIHATEYANLRDAGFWRLLRPDPRWSVALAVLVLSLGLVLQSLKHPLHRLGVGLAVGVTVLSVDLMLLAWLGLGLPLLTLASAIGLVTLLSSAEATLRLQWERLKLKRTLSRYLSAAVAEEVMQQGESWTEALQGRRCDVVVLMTDIRGFTAMTSRYANEGREAELVNRLNDYFSMIVHEILEEGATIDKFIGDASLSYFGAPLSKGSQADAAAALRAARRVVRGLERLNSDWCQQGFEPWQQVVVLSAGTVICGNIGSPERLEYTVIGDAVNRASRLEAIAKQTGAAIVASAGVIDRLSVNTEVDPLGAFPIRGQDLQTVYSIRVGREEGGDP